MVVAGKNLAEDIEVDPKSAIDFQALLKNPQFLKSFTALVQNPGKAVVCDDDDTEELLVKQPKAKPVKVVTCLVGIDKAIRFDLDFGEEKSRSWIVRDHKDLITTKTVKIDAIGCDKVVLKNVFSNGSRSIIEIDPDGDSHTCLFVNEDQRIRIIYVEGQLEILVDHKMDIEGFSVKNGNAKRLKYNVKGKLCPDKLFGDDHNMKEDERHSTDGYGPVDQQKLMAALPAAKSLFFGE